MKRYFERFVRDKSFRFSREKYELALLTLARAVTVGASYVSAAPIPGLTSSFVAIFTSLLPFDIMVAAERPPIRWDDLKRFFLVLWPRVVSTAITLLKGVAVGTVFGIASVLGLPFSVGAVLTSGLAYVWASQTRHNISTYVALIAGLGLFDRLSSLEVVETLVVVQEIVRSIVVSGGGTLLGLASGWVVGFITGSVTRLLLSRPYRSLRSAAYDPPMEARPFRELMRVSGRTVLASATIEEGAPASHKLLAECRLRDEWQTTVLSVKRGDEEFVMPRGTLVLMPGDELVLLSDRDHLPLVQEQFKAAAAVGSVDTA